ncbi:NAD(P)H-hydrate dehydratase [Leucobacter soli]|uniref:NAD(P)H-hydrate dehydratase n=1 Tax=Leucobacter soli TaxID=2812850 RepID=UPI0036122600
MVDAGALLELAAPEVLAAARDRVAPIVATPHLGEFRALWRAVEPETELPQHALPRAASALAERLGSTILLKGSVTLVATPGGFCAAAGPATPWLATAGTGDVLAGILGALAATHAAELREDPERFGPLAASAAVLHAAAACRASQDGRAPIAALDVARALPETIAALLP